MSAPVIGIFDSGVGGLSVLTACKQLMPNEQFLYFADTDFAPYGDKSNLYIRRRVFSICDNFVAKGAKAIVVACNTATNVGIKMLRQRYSIPFVGLEPAIKPAQHIEGEVVLLCTTATARQDKFLRLVEAYRPKNLIIAPQKNLAGLIEKNFANLERVRHEVYKTLAPYIKASAIILGCTHYVHIKQQIDDFYLAQGASVPQILDGNDGAARRLQNLLSN